MISIPEVEALVAVSWIRSEKFMKAYKTTRNRALTSVLGSYPKRTKVSRQGPSWKTYATNGKWTFELGILDQLDQIEFDASKKNTRLVDFPCFYRCKLIEYCCPGPYRSLLEFLEVGREQKLMSSRNVVLTFTRALWILVSTWFLIPTTAGEGPPGICWSYRKVRWVKDSETHTWVRE